MALSDRSGAGYGAGASHRAQWAHVGVRRNAREADRRLVEFRRGLFEPIARGHGVTLFCFREKTAAVPKGSASCGPYAHRSHRFGLAMAAERTTTAAGHPYNWRVPLDFCAHRRSLELEPVTTLAQSGEEIAPCGHRASGAPCRRLTRWLPQSENRPPSSPSASPLTSASAALFRPAARDDATMD